ncbi:PREDICTED: glutathione S-transferase T3-like [Camelina sativa]|uniref:Glutathione S-transferase T3-like n=1 Tax=Camelina sativa TaxID=90675 RepID=A0ABM0SZX1_CAMSA|nr:PREDICTED: glutathione S-transferase T3-like [Camelina sativa]
MDPRNPYRFWDQNFVDLLNSQKDSNCSDNPIPPISTLSSQPIQFTNKFSSQPLNFSPGFSSQPLKITPTSESEDCTEVTADEIDEDGGRGSRKRWSAEEDVHLIRAWLNTNNDPVVSNGQRLQSFWKRVADYYKAHDGDATSNARGPSQSSTRRKSGQSEDDVVSMAYEFYKNDMKKSFMLGHCWRELKNDQKWITERHEECSNKRTKLASEGDFSAPSSNGGDEMRPPGIIAMKDQEQAAKERHDKMKLLDSLLNKGELTPAEVLLKDKLVDQMLTNI